MIIEPLSKLSSISLRTMRNANVWVLAQTPMRAVPIGSLNIDGSFWVNVASLYRAANDNLIKEDELTSLLIEVTSSPISSSQELALPSEFMQKDGTKWITSLLDKFVHVNFS